jgi:hypothetical protein
MTRVRCHYLDCAFLDERFCSAAAVELDPDSGCITYSAVAGEEADVDEWDEEKDIEDWDQIGTEEDDEEDLWMEEEDEY